MNYLLKLLAVAFCFAIISCDSDSELDGPDTVNVDQEINTETVDIIDPFSGAIQGTSTLRRNLNSIDVTFRAKDLTPDNAYTLWWVIWNKPENCLKPNACGEIDFVDPDLMEVEVMYAAGQLVGIGGSAIFSAHLKNYDSSGSINDLFNMPNYGGLQNSQRAEIHLVLRDHGPAIPGQIADQIGSYEGGCLYDLGAFSGDVPDAPGECADLLAAVHSL